MHSPLHALAAALCAAFLILAAGCASAPRSPLPDEKLLVAAGFKTVAARTSLQQQHLQTLQQGAISQMQQTGKHYYVYPDVPNSRLYVGTPKEYQAYLALLSRNGLPQPTPSDATTRDIRSYLRQDAAMTQADAQAATIPPWAIWPDFGDLGWVP